MNRLLISGLATVLVVSGAFFWFQDGIAKGNNVVKIEKDLGAGNLGTHTFYYVHLENGSRFTYDYYQSNHPLCPENPDKCGEGSKDSGWDEINRTVHSELFTETENPGGRVFWPVNSVCLDSRTSIVSC